MSNENVILKHDIEKSIFISEIFGPTIQGEGTLIGKPTVFVRTGGCDYRCSWCDTLYAVEAKYKPSWTQMSADEILRAVKKLTNNTPILITLSGGNPAIYDLSELITLGHKQGFTFSMETQGSINKAYFNKIDYLTISPKPPSANIETNLQILDEILQGSIETNNATLKIVINDDVDYQWAKEIANKYQNIQMTLQPCNLNAGDEAVDIKMLNDKLKWLIEKTSSDYWYNVTLLPQLHVMLWKNERGV